MDIKGNDRYQHLFQRVPIGMYLSTPGGEILDANPALLKMLGYKNREEFLAVSIEQTYLDPNDRQRWRAMMEEDEVVRNYEMQLLKADGTRIWVRDNASAVKDDTGQVLYYEGSLEDITSRRRNEEKLHEQRRSLHMVISSMPNLVIKVDDQNRLSAFAAPPHFPGFLRSSDNPIGQPITDMLPEEAAGQIVEAVAQVREAGKSRVLEYSSNSGDQPAYFEVKISPVSDSKEVLVVVDNITDRKLAELAEHDQRMLAMAMSEIAILLNSTLDLNNVFDRILETLEHIVACDIADIMLIEDDAARIVGSRGYETRGMDHQIPSIRLPLAEVHNLRMMVETGRPMMIVDTKADPGWVGVPETDWIRSYIGAPIRVQGEVIGFINLNSSAPSSFNATHAERLEVFAAQAAVAIQNARLYQTLKQQTLELEQANRELEAFSHTVAHDLKAPLQVVVGYISLFQAEFGATLDADALTMLKEMSAATQRMSGIIDSLLLLAKLRHVEEQLVAVEIPPVATAARDRFKNLIDERGVTVSIAEEMPPAIGYGPWLEEVFANLISNAIKYIGRDNPDPRIEVQGVPEGDRVRYEVKDNGLGITEEDQARLFEMFSRFHTDQASGLGLGMSIVQRIVDRLHGELGVESAPGKGSTFWFSLPAVNG